jgi:GT2 family glycosyltransferase
MGSDQRQLDESGMGGGHVAGARRADVDIVSVFHRDSYQAMSEQLREELDKYEPNRCNFIGVDNRQVNVGFGPGCNKGAATGNAPIIGLLNPDTRVNGQFLDAVIAMLAQPDVVITGERFDKPQREIKTWGCDDWVCGAAMFIRRDFWEMVGGFDPRFAWSWEETDLIRTAQSKGFKVVSIRLPITHSSPLYDEPADVAYTGMHFALGASRFKEKWG